jgi:UDP-N-acetylmuramoylalanine--D-glutamate ligase
MARWCARCGAQVTVADTREAPPNWRHCARQLPRRTSCSGLFDAALVQGTPMCARCSAAPASPAIVAPVDRRLHRRMGLWVHGGELGLFAQALADLKA